MLSLKGSEIFSQDAKTHVCGGETSQRIYLESGSHELGDQEDKIKHTQNYNNEIKLTNNFSEDRNENELIKKTAKKNDFYDDVVR